MIFFKNTSVVLAVVLSLASTLCGSKRDFNSYEFRNINGVWLYATGLWQGHPVRKPEYLQKLNQLADESDEESSSSSISSTQSLSSASSASSEEEDDNNTSSDQEDYCNEEEYSADEESSDEEAHVGRGPIRYFFQQDEADNVHQPINDETGAFAMYQRLFIQEPLLMNEINALLKARMLPDYLEVLQDPQVVFYANGIIDLMSSICEIPLYQIDMEENNVLIFRCSNGNEQAQYNINDVEGHQDGSDMDVEEPNNQGQIRVTHQNVHEDGEQVQQDELNIEQNVEEEEQGDQYQDVQNIDVSCGMGQVMPNPLFHHEQEENQQEDQGDDQVEFVAPNDAREVFEAGNNDEQVEEENVEGEQSGEQENDQEKQQGEQQEIDFNQVDLNDYEVDLSDHSEEELDEANLEKFKKWKACLHDSGHWAYRKLMRLVPYGLAGAILYEIWLMGTADCSLALSIPQRLACLGQGALAPVWISIKNHLLIPLCQTIVT